MKRNHRRRRGVYISPLLIAAGALVVALGIFLLSRAFRGGETEPKGPETNQDAREPDDGVQSQGEKKPAHAATDSGIACTLTDLGEDALHTGELILVNNWTLYHFPEEQELVCMLEKTSGDYYVRDYSVYLSPVAMDAFNRLMADFRAQGGSKTVNVVAGYRTEADQQHLFDQSVERNGREHAEKYVAQPGGSEHHTGLVVDLSILRGDGTSEDYDGSGEYAWINKNCKDYGWVVRYDQAKAELTGIYDEPWHFRYVGVPHAAKMVELGLCLEEYIDYLKQFTFEGEHLTIDCGQGKYEVWYAQGSEVYLPDSGDYQVSGNNVDGLIVTCRVE